MVILCNVKFVQSVGCEPPKRLIITSRHIQGNFVVVVVVWCSSEENEMPILTQNFSAFVRNISPFDELQTVSIRKAMMWIISWRK